jgi:putative cell wall-binding protein
MARSGAKKGPNGRSPGAQHHGTCRRYLGHMVRASRLLALTTAVVVALAMHATPAHASIDSDEWAFVSRLNAARASAGLPPVAVLSALRDSARQQSAQMAGRGALFHTVDLAAVATRAASDWTRAAENVGRGGDVAAIDQAFLESPGHRANVLGAFNYVGVGVVHAASSIWVTVQFVAAAPGRPTLQPAPSVPTTRLAGTSGSDTSLAVSRAFPAGSARAVVVGRNDVFADGLAGGPLAAVNEGPVLLSDSATPSPGIVEEARRVLRSTGVVYLLGGPDALAPAVEDAFAGAGMRVQRVFGADRYETARAVARLVATAPSEVLLVSGTNFADAMVAGPVGSKLRAPILLTSPTGVPRATAEHLAGLPQARRTVIGGPAAVTDEAYAQASADERVAGLDRFETSVRVAQRWWPSVSQVSLATGTTFQDALAGAAYSARTGVPLVLVSAEPTDAVRSYMSSIAGGLAGTIVYGTVATLSDTTLALLFG